VLLICAKVDDMGYAHTINHQSPKGNSLDVQRSAHVGWSINLLVSVAPVIA